MDIPELLKIRHYNGRDKNAHCTRDKDRLNAAKNPKNPTQTTNPKGSEDNNRTSLFLPVAHGDIFSVHILLIMA